MKKLYSFIILVALLFVLTGCGNTNNNANNVANKNTAVQNKISNTENSNTTQKNSIDDVDYEGAAQKQMALPAEGEQIAIIHVKNFGDIKVKFFPDVAPKAVENFVKLSSQGYYNGVTFHRVINEFMIQGGDPTGTGRGGESIYGKGFGEEVALELVPYRGSLCMASTGYGTNGIGSQFFITQANYSETMAKRLKQSGYPAGVIEQYKNYGGYLSLYLQYTVFGQVFEGMDVVDKIAKVETETTQDGQQDKPVEDVVIEKIDITTYGAK